MKPSPRYSTHDGIRPAIAPEPAPLELPPRIAGLFKTARRPADLPLGASSVLATIIVDGNDLSFLFTRRTTTMSAFAGHLSFPGGRIDAGDETPLATALRETAEEIGLTRERIRPLGYFTELHTHFGTLVICYGGAIRAAHVPTSPTSPREVAEILRVPIESLRRPGRARALGIEPSLYRATDYEARRIGSPHAPSRTLHYWDLTNDLTRERTVLWGLTGEIVSRFLHAAYDWSPPSPPRLVERVEELQP